DHFIKRYAECPQIGLMIHLRLAQPFRRTIAGAAKSMMREVVRERDRFRDAEIQQADFVIKADLHVGWLYVAVNHRPALPIDIGQEGMQAVELVADIERDSGGPHRLDELLRPQDLGHVSALNVLHRDEETAVV